MSYKRVEMTEWKYFRDSNWQFLKINLLELYGNFCPLKSSLSLSLIDPLETEWHLNNRANLVRAWRQLKRCPLSLQREASSLPRSNEEINIQNKMPSFAPALI